MTEILYILTRTSGRPAFFAACRASVKALSWDGPVVHIVHTDDPRDLYVDGDVIVKGETYGPSFGPGFYNLYNNRLLRAISTKAEAQGWVFFLDDDDRFLAPDSLAWLAGANRDVLHVCKTRRKGVSKHCQIFPAQWKKQKTFQTECFAVWSTIARKHEWWGQKGGDHHYTKKITHRTPVVWHDVIATEAQEGKGRGECADADGKRPDKSAVIAAEEKVWFKMFATIKGTGKQTQLIHIPHGEAATLEKHSIGRVTFKGVREVREHA